MCYCFTSYRLFLSFLCLTLIALPIIIICTSQAYSEENGEHKNTTATKQTTSDMHKKTILKNDTENLTSSQPTYVGYKITQEKPLDTLNVGTSNNKPMKAYSRQISPSSCTANANFIFINFIKDFVGETNKYNNLYWELTNLSCIFFTLIKHKSNSKVKCLPNPTTFLEFKDRDALWKLKDFNKEDEDALFDYVQLLTQFLPSLSLIETTMATSKLYKTEIQFVEKGVIQIQQAMIQTRKEIIKCSIISPKKRNKLADIVLQFNDPATQVNYTAEERAMAVFKQLKTVLTRLMKMDFEKRKKCIS